MQNFYFSQYILSIKAETSLLLPAYKGSTLRGGFGHAFRRIVCVNYLWAHSDGRAVEYLPYFIYAFVELGYIGIGSGKGKYQLLEVAEKNPQGLKVIYHVHVGKGSSFGLGKYKITSPVPSN